MRDDQILDLFLEDVKAWVKKTTGHSPDSGYEWFYSTMYQNYPALLLWHGSQRVFAEKTPKRKKRRSTLRLVH